MQIRITICFRKSPSSCGKPTQNFEEIPRLVPGCIDKALVFLYLEDKNYREISETLGITEVNARVKMNRIKGKLKKILNP